MKTRPDGDSLYTALTNSQQTSLVLAEELNVAALEDSGILIEFNYTTEGRIFLELYDTTGDTESLLRSSEVSEDSVNAYMEGTTDVIITGKNVLGSYVDSLMGS